MRKFLLLASVGCLLAGVAGCDTTQPLQSGEQLLEISVVASNVTVFQYDTWDQFRDLNGNGEFDEDTETMETWCQKVVDGSEPTGFRTRNASSIPWPYSLKVTIIRDGTTVREVLTTNAALNSTFNLTPFDDWQETFQPLPPTCLGDPQLVCIPTGRVTSANQIVMDSDFFQDPIFQCPGDPDLPAPRMNGTVSEPGSPPFGVTVRSGDTVIVEASKNPTDIGSVERLTQQPVLIARATLNGQAVIPTGTTTSTTQVGSGLSFSINVR